MSKRGPDQTSTRDIDGHLFRVEIWDDRVLAYGPRPVQVLLFSFTRPVSNNRTSWEMIDLIISRRVTELLKKNPERWNEWYGEDGKYTNA